jgi:hypothetical protein
MGLDMYAYVTPLENIKDSLSMKDPDDILPIYSWRCRPNIHAWMERLWEIKCKNSGNSHLVGTRTVPPFNPNSLRIIRTDEASKTTVQVSYSDLSPEEQQIARSGIEAEYAKFATVSKFNQTPLLITTQDLDLLHQDIQSKSLPDGFGPFFGENRQNETTQQEDLYFITMARMAMSKGFAVYYFSHW